jgi:tRNA threonylcarbamoyladenosine biosynthesis protein TsaB
VVRDGATLATSHWRTDRSHMGELPEQVERLLATAGVGWDALDGLAVSIGPGSFTGLRIAVAFAKGVAFAGTLRTAAVPTLEALAAVAEAPAGTRVCAALDARKREIYAALFLVEAGGVLVRESPDAVWKPPALGTACDAATIVVGDAPDVYPAPFAAARVLPFTTHHPRGDVVARLGAAHMAAGRDVPLAALEPAYVRAPDAKLPANPLR